MVVNPTDPMLANPGGISAGQLIMSAIGNKLKGFLGASPAPKAAAPTEEQRKNLALQSQRVHLNMLAREGRFNEIVQIAETTTEQDIAGCAVSVLARAETDQLTALEHLARSHSHAAVLAMIALFNNTHHENGKRIFVTRLKNGELARLVSSGHANLFSILDILGWLQKYGDGSFVALNHFPELWQCLSDRTEQVKVLGQMYGDPDPLGMRYIHEPNVIPGTIKLHAMSMLPNFTPAEQERFLIYASRDDDDRVAHAATVSLVNTWRSEAGLVPPGLEYFRMLDLNLLFHLCQISSSFQWGEPVEHFYERYKAHYAELAETDPYNDTTRYEQLMAIAEELDRELVRITERRINSLQPVASKISTLLNLPVARLESTEEDVNAAYLIGSGKVQVKRQVLMEDKPLSEDVMSALLHEIGHMEQDVLVIRMIADEIGLKFGQHSQQLEQLYERYAAGIGYAPDSMFLLAVLRLRNDKPLTPAEKVRAMRLYGAAHQAKINANQGRMVQGRLDQINESIDALSGGNYDVELLNCLRSQHGLDSLFQRGQVPAVLVAEMNSCAQDLYRIVNNHYQLNGAPYLVRNGKKLDIITLAREIYMSEAIDAVAPIITKLRALLVQILREESAVLHKRLTQIWRTGYHEAEAYVISDRVSVIVKAIRKNWFQTS
ncbi:MAG: hypothetical protein U0103_08075 [Candidatus Obscuribacterales bacterium]